MNGFSPGLFDRLLNPAARAGANATRISSEQLKDAVARDLENLLNTRCAIPDDLLDGYPECRRSILNYGLIDFAGMCMTSSEDRARICAHLKAAIERHEPRLRHVQASLEREEGGINRVRFVISGVLAVHTLQETINFDAVLQPSSQHYSINQSTRGATA